MLLLIIAGLFVSNNILKKEYGKADKSDLYWNYGKILEQPFSHKKFADTIFISCNNHSTRII